MHVRAVLVRVMAVCLLAAMAPQASAQTMASGTVIDVSGLAVAGAEITARTSGGQTTTTTAGPDGRFTVQGPVVSLRATAPGFAPTDVDEVSSDMQAVLRPATFADSVVVTATRRVERLPSATPSTVVTSAELGNSAAGALDEVLRSTPGSCHD